MSRPIERNVFTPPAWELAAFVPLFEASIPNQVTSHPPSQPVQPQSEGEVERFLMGRRPVQGVWAKRLAATAIIIGMFAIAAYMIWWQIPEVKTQAVCFDWFLNRHPEQVGILLMNRTFAGANASFNITPP